MNEKYSREVEAMKAATALMEQANEVARLFRLAAVPLPPSIARMLGDSESSVRDTGMPSAPPEWRENWIWVPLQDLTPLALIPAVLRMGGGSMSVKETLRKIKAINTGMVVGSLYNAGAKLIKDRMITKSVDGWRLADKNNAPVIYEEYAWGELGWFGKYEVAAHRRFHILKLLEDNPGGLMIMQIVNGLESRECKGPVNKDLVKMDMSVLLKEERAKRVAGHSRKWILTKGGEAK